jgi:arsenite methyltransferase
LWTTGAGLLLTAGVMVWGSKVGKLRLREKVLDQISWKGNEQVLDVGCGHGLMLIGAAKRLTTGGKVIGIDIWQTEDQAGNSPAATRANLACEGVSDRAEILGADARAIPFGDGTFDVIVSSWALHNIYDVAERTRAVREICRVLKAGGKLAVTDIRHSAEYAAEFERAGLVKVRRSWPNFLFVTPTMTVFAEKPGLG